jgi:outer membrane lipoprotein SlyB
MKRYLLAGLLTASMLAFTGCATGGYSQADVGSVKTVNRGTVIGTRNLTVGDDGTGSLLGGIAGGAAGSQIGKGDGKVAAVIGGAVLGAMLGGDLNKDAGQELTIKLDNGQEIITVYKVDKNAPYMYRSGDRVMVETLNSKVSSIRPLN